MLNVSVVVPSLNEAKLLPEFFASLQKQRLRPNEILIVDGGSSDDTREVVAYWRKKLKRQAIEVKLIELGEKGITKARDRGFRQARYELIMSADADTTYHKDYLYRAVGWMQTRDPRCVAVVGNCYSLLYTNWYIRVFEWGQYWLNSLTLRLFKTVVDLRAFNVVFLKDAYVKSGGMDTNIYAVEDEFGLSRLLRTQGLIGREMSMIASSSDRRINKGVLHFIFVTSLYNYWLAYLWSKLFGAKIEYKRVD